jgi:hypothetical protein
MGTSRGYIRRYNIWQALKASCVIYWRHFLPLAAIPAIVEAPFRVVGDAAVVIGFPGVGQMVDALSVILTITTWYLSIGEVSSVCFGGDVSLARAFRRLSLRELAKFLALVFAILLAVVLVFVVAMFAGALVAAAIGAGPAASFVSAGGVLAGAVLAGVLLLTYPFIGQVVILERRHWIDAVIRALRLMARSPVQTFLGALVFTTFGTIPGIPTQLLYHQAAVGSVSQFVFANLGTVVDVLTTPFFPICFTVWYYSLRVRSQDVSLEELVDLQLVTAA